MTRIVVAVALLAAIVVALRPRRHPVPATRWRRVEPLLNTNGVLPAPEPYVLVLYQRRGMGTGGNSDRAVWA